jgi:hypothetical protein
MSEEIKQSATPNESPVKHCLYFVSFTEEEKTFYEEAIKAEALEEEITLLRVRIMSLALHQPDNISLLLRALACLDRLCRTNKKVFQHDRLDAEKIKQNTIALFKGINLPTDFIEKKFT